MNPYTGDHCDDMPSDRILEASVVEIARVDGKPTEPGPEAWFTGTVWLDEFAKLTGSKKSWKRTI
jgi:hypothetical protein